MLKLDAELSECLSHRSLNHPQFISHVTTRKAAALQQGTSEEHIMCDLCRRGLILQCQPFAFSFYLILKPSECTDSKVASVHWQRMLDNTDDCTNGESMGVWTQCCALSFYFNTRGPIGHWRRLKQGSGSLSSIRCSVTPNPEYKILRFLLFWTRQRSHCTAGVLLPYCSLPAPMIFLQDPWCLVAILKTKVLVSFCCLRIWGSVLYYFALMVVSKSTKIWIW